MSNDKQPQCVDFAGYSLQGVRSENQDTFIIKQPTHWDELVYKGIVACIADGVSCSQQGQQASHTATSQFIMDYYATPISWSVQSSVHSLLKSLNAWLFSQGKDQLQHNGMITTLSAVVIKSNTAHLFHIGDSRIYLYREQTLTQLTRDHLRHNRSQHNYLTRALGMDEHIEVDYQTLDLRQEDLLLLTTDGSHGFLSADEIKKALNEKNSLETISRTLCQTALKNGSQDNASCVLLRILNLPNKSLLEHQQQLLNRQPLPVLKTGQTVDGFQVIKTLHESSRSHVYLVTDTANGALRTLKAPSMNHLDDQQALLYFANEYWIASQLNSPRLMKMYPSPKDTKFLYQISEFIDGMTLRQWMYDHPMPPLDSVRKILDELVRALRVLQRANMVHRDLKPKNIMLTKHHAVKIIDFGTVDAQGLREAQPFQTSDVPLGSINYTAPEYINTGQSTILSDLFSIGVIGYEMPCGALPYKTPTSQNIQSARRAKWQYRSIQNDRSDIPLWVDLALQKATAPNPKQRHQALGDFITDITIPNERLINNPRNTPLLRRNPILVWKILTFVSVLIAVLEGLLLLAPSPLYH